MRKRVYSILAGLMSLSLILSACAMPQNTTTSQGSAPTPTQQPSAPAKTTLTTSMPTDVTFHPIIGTDRPSAYTQKFIYEGLTRVNEKLEPVGNLAESWSISPDGLTWTFKLKSNVKWHDGKPFTANDVKYTFDNLLDAKNAWRYRSNFALVAKVEVVDATTVKFVTKEPFAAMPAMLSYYAFILPQHILGDNFMKNDNFNLQQPVGTGPFKVAEVRRGQYIRFVANQEHHRGGPKLKEVIVKVVADPDTVVAQLMSGEMDLNEISPGRHISALQTNPNMKIDSFPTTNYNHAMINHEDERFKDPRVRLALIHALDRKKIIDSVMMGHAVLPTATIPTSIAWAHNSNIQPLEYNSQKAKQLLAEAGWTQGKQYLEKDGKPFSFVISADNVDVARRETAVIAQQYWRAIGLDARLEVMDWNVWLAERFRKVPEVTNGYWSKPTDPNQTSYWGCGGSINYSKYCNQQVNSLFAAAAKELDLKKRADLYHQIQSEMMKDPPTIIFYYVNEVLAMNKKLQGFPKLQWRDALDWVDQWQFQG